MSLRSRLFIAFGVIVLIPVALLAFGLRQEMTARLSHEHQLRVDAVVETIREDFRRESAGIRERLASLKRSLPDDNRFRVAAVAGNESERRYLIFYAGTAMDLTGLTMLQIQAEDGRILSSGHFRNEHGRIEHGLPEALSEAGDVALLMARAPEGEFLVLACAETFELGGREFALVGGISVDAAFLARLARDPEIVVSLRHEGGTISSKPEAESESSPSATPANVAVGTLVVPLIHASPETALDVGEARLEVTQSLAPLQLLLSSVDFWFLITAVGTGLAALLLAVGISSRISRPLADLAQKTAVLDLDRLDVDFGGGSGEVGALSRLLGDLVTRLRASTARVRDAERRATIGDVARQVNHDIKNGLIPLRNVMTHLEQVERDAPDSLPAVFAERRQTMASSLAYLDTLARSYQRLSPSPVHHDCDLNALANEVIRAAEGHRHVECTTRLAENLPPIAGDPIALRRILENLVANAVDSLESKPGRVSVSTERVERDGSSWVHVEVADTGCGMSKDELGRIFNDFYTTKEGGAGLGLSIVRRLVMDLQGSLSVESELGSGTRIMIDFPAGSQRPG